MRNCSFSLRSAGKLLALVVVVWIILILYISQPLLRHSDHDYEQDKTELILARLSRATSELEILRTQNQELKSIVQNYVSSSTLSKNSDNNDNFHHASSIIGGGLHRFNGPDKQYELTRRRLGFNLNELRFFLRNSLSLNSTVVNFINQHYANYLYDLDKIAERDLLWRKNEFQALSNTVIHVMERLQNPVDCENANKLLCKLNKGCGFGCQIHHVAYCFMMAMASNRTLILDAQNWRYVPSVKSANAGWNLVFKPLSNSCTLNGSYIPKHWSHNSKAKVVNLPIIDALRPRPDYLPLAIPEEISQKLITLHGTPSAWFIGHIVHYIMRPSAEMESFLAKARENFRFRTPIVGVHVRRTDKVGTEAAFHPLSEYMKYVEEYFDSMEIARKRAEKTDPLERIVYLATDETSIWRDEIKPYEQKGYIFIGDSQIAQTAGLGQRYSIDSLKNVILDIKLLSECDFLVCTFSSQVCRVAYELMQTREFDGQGKPRFDWSDSFVSLDDIYYFGGQNAHNQIAILDHAGTAEEIDLKAGDLVGIAGNHWNGYSKGTNKRNKKTGLYPGFKTVEKVDVAKFDAFEGFQ
ncbi:alpha-(1,6)-fucosyltransferase 8 [Brevipalpus obovatus]|uniref:alpha-(1,6)-fucosyltransferase 8 n=1 Tax=Brevipalpus obovatus TaxID=246614 RepID=UPI003D9EC5E5